MLDANPRGLEAVADALMERADALVDAQVKASVSSPATTGSRCPR